MFKYDKGVLPQPINNLFAVNNERHKNTRNGEIVYKLVSFHGVHIWNHISKKFQLMYHNNNNNCLKSNIQ